MSGGLTQLDLGTLSFRTALENFRADGIYVLPETVSDLPPVAGILTEGEGNPLSHVQLLARNLGIPNVTVDSSLKAALVVHSGERVVLDQVGIFADGVAVRQVGQEQSVSGGRGSSR